MKSHKFLLFTLFIFPNIALSSSCWDNVTLSDFVILDDNIFVTFTVTDSQISENRSDEGYMDISITQEFNSDIIKDPNIRINAVPSVGLTPPLSGFTKGVEWLSVLKKTGESDYTFAACAPQLKIENGNVIGATGISALDESAQNITLEQFTLALSVYQQGISSVDLVCRNINSHCTGTRATYDAATGILNLPTVLVSQPIIGESFKDAKMKITGEDPVTFSVIEINN